MLPGADARRCYDPRVGDDEAVVRVRRMDVADLPAVRRVEAGAFDESWPATAFEHELERNPAARYIVVVRDGLIVAFGGLWLQFDQGHIVTVAVDATMRRSGLGRVVTHALVEIARAMGMTDATLEVRESNAAARALYREYGFYEVGRRVRYYADNGEDAVIMTTEPLTSPAYLERLARLESKLASRFGSGVVEEVDGERLSAGWGVGGGG
jgi:ribosomal-protein-alanine N-acetyltransferase